MKPYNELSNKIYVAANLATNKDKKHESFYRQHIKTSDKNKQETNSKKQSNKKSFWLGEERRLGGDRRMKKNNRFKRFEHRFQHDRRRKANILIKV